MSSIFNQVNIGSLNLKNRMGMAPMSTYMAINGNPNDWHYLHYASRATSLGIIIVEATAISRDSLVTKHDLVMDEFSDLSSFEKLARLIKLNSCVACIQLNHGGPKAWRSRPWEGDQPLGEKYIENVVGPSEVAFAEGFPVPISLSKSQIGQIIENFVKSALLAKQVGFDAIELHAGHGRLLHAFISPITNSRDDEYGGNLNGRVKILISIVKEIKRLSIDIEVFVRLSCVDWMDSGLNLNDSVKISQMLKEVGVTLIDCSSGGIVRPIHKEVYPGYQLECSRIIKNEVDIATAGVGLLNDYNICEYASSADMCDVLLVGRKLMTDPQFVQRIAAHSGHLEFVPQAYQRAYKTIGKDISSHNPEL